MLGRLGVRELGKFCLNPKVLLGSWCREAGLERFCCRVEERVGLVTMAEQLSRFCSKWEMVGWSGCKGSLYKSGRLGMY